MSGATRPARLADLLEMGWVNRSQGYLWAARAERMRVLVAGRELGRAMWSFLVEVVGLSSQAVNLRMCAWSVGAGQPSR